ncbi:thiamine diphosphokinase [Mesobacterium pallidum]|uniref:thiamine diphosphokinase n=1 Tax=Mesobacterium pallidum TaxID=2872037 RepID=UPI001EE36201|nr:thiamine diphosphokinase [Mesobacterium pallidum]
MNAPIVLSAEPVALVGGGDCSPHDLALIAGRVSDFVAADSGAESLLTNNLPIRAVFGDMDSIPAPVRAAVPEGRLHEIEEQDSTDFDKCLRHVEAPLILAAGFLGARIDHQMAAQTTLVRHPHKRCVLLGAHDIVFLAPPRISLALEPGSRVSLFPMGPVTGRSTGLDWPIDGLEFAPDGRIGTSNRTAGGAVTLAFDAPRMLVILPRAALDATQAGLTAAPARWPAP